MSNPARKIIGFCNRPQVMPFKGLFDLKANFLRKAGMKAVNREANTATPAMAVDGTGTPEAMKLWWREIDDAGISAVVVNGRYAAGLEQFPMDNEALVKSRNPKATCTWPESARFKNSDMEEGQCWPSVDRF